MTIPMNLKHKIQQVKDLIAKAERDYHRAPGSVALLAVSKQHCAESIRMAAAAGLCDFGENYVQEAESKIQQLQDLNLSWHFIGPIQSNKTKAIARHFSWVHGINRIKVATLLSEHRPSDLAPLNVCLQINVIDEDTKAGISPQQALDLARAVSQLPGLSLRGLMTLPPPQSDPEQQYQAFMQLNTLMHSLNQELHLNMDTLSMGMSDDLIPAIRAGTTMVRIGRAIFGARIYED